MSNFFNRYRELNLFIQKTLSEKGRSVHVTEDIDESTILVVSYSAQENQVDICLKEIPKDINEDAKVFWILQGDFQDAFDMGFTTVEP